ncbi:MAG: acyl-CoA dehydrogenase family protein [Chloroflexi bacterium]|nr:acyl-CoA dehydrogenase family protein [Chloroflexota bacterium]
MEFRFTPEQEAFRTEVRSFLHGALPSGWRGVYPDAYFHDEYWGFIRQFTRKLVDKGWLTMPWPKAYGGQELPLLMQTVYNEEIAYARAPVRDLMTGVQMVAPTLMIHGSDEQKRRYIPPIAKGEDVYGQGFSEPGVGSDLASLQCRAVRDGDDYVVNGSKIWTSGAQRSSHCMLLTRTDPDVPKHKGITVFLVPMNTPGITVRPIQNPLGVHYFNEVFFDNVRVPRDTMLGPENRGWYVATTTLDFERSGVGRFSQNRRSIEELVELAHDVPWTGKSTAERSVIRHAIADVAIANAAGRLVAWRVAWMQSRGLVPNQEASASKLMGSEIAQRISQVAVRLVGLYGQLDRGNARAPADGRVMAEYVNDVAATIRAGTSEVQRNIIATRGLGLPR